MPAAVMIASTGASQKQPQFPAYPQRTDPSKIWFALTWQRQENTMTRTAAVAMFLVGVSAGLAVDSKAENRQIGDAEMIADGTLILYIYGGVSF
jgi:hypothetical protein